MDQCCHSTAPAAQGITGFPVRATMHRLVRYATVIALMAAASLAVEVAYTGGNNQVAAASRTFDGEFSGAGFLRAGTTTTVKIAGRGAIPANADTVALSIVATQAANPGWAVVWACDETQPTASNINYQSSTDIANTVLTKLDTNGNVCIYTSQPTHFIIDVSGYFTGTDFQPRTPARLLDTRPSATTFDGEFSGAGFLRAGTTTTVKIAGRGAIPANADTVALSIVATQAANPGWAVVWACDETQPTASNINYQSSTDIANTVLTKLDTNGNVCIYTSQPTHFIIDVSGYFTGTDFQPRTPARLLDTRPESPEAEAEDYSLFYLNQLRASLGLAKVSIDPNMAAFARQWSITMSQSGFGHSGGPWAENVAWTSQGELTPQQAALQLHTQWVNSPPHYANMTEPTWRFMGAGMLHNSSGWWGTHVFNS